MTPTQLSQARVLVVGDIMLDRYWFGDASRISPEAPVPVVRVQKSDERLGGAANVARNAAALCAQAGGKVGMLGVVGQDEPGRTVARLLDESHVSHHLHQDDSLDTTIKLRILAQRQQLLRVDFESTPDHEVLKGVQENYQTQLAHYDVILLSDYGKGGLTHVSQMIAQARAANKTVLIDPKGEDYSKYQGASILTPNRSELKQVIGAWRSEEDLHTKAQNLRRTLQLEALLLTRSEEGMTLFTEGDVFHVPAQAREVFDVSGAGDTVIATLAVMLGAGAPLKEAVQAANRAGAIVVGKLGTATVSYQELFA